MGTKHKHYNVIVAWAAGEEIEYWSDSLERWYPCLGAVIFREDFQYRIKPKLVKKEGWVNVYPDKYSNYETEFHFTKNHADCLATEARIACIRIEWEEEQ